MAEPYPLRGVNLWDIDLKNYIDSAIADGVAAGVAGSGVLLDGNNNVNLTSGSEYFAHFTIVNDDTDSSAWPNRLEFEYKPYTLSTVGQHLTGWFNEYGEFRCTPAKDNTVPFRVFSKELSTDVEHSNTVPVMEMVWSRNVRTPIWGVMADGTMYTTGPIERRIPSGPTLTSGHLILTAAASVPVNTPAGTLIVRI